MGLIGVANGADGDLRTGLPYQMVEIHDPIRLLMVVEQDPAVVVKVLEFNENVTKCFDWNGNPVSSYTSYVNIRQHFFKYYDLQVDASITLEEYTKKYPCNTDGANLPGKKKPVVKSRQRKYKVKSGDTLSEIAQKYHTSVSKIKKANGLRSDLIRTGQVLKIP
jgi:LysM repeat protein